MSNTDRDGQAETHGASQLSPDGTRRRGDILIELERALSRRQRRKLARRGALAGTGVLALLASGYIAMVRTSPVQPEPPREQLATSAGSESDVHEDRPSPADVRSSPRLVEIIGDDPEAARRLAAPAVPIRTVRIDDDELLNLLAEAGKPDGLIRVGGAGGRVMLSSEFQTAMGQARSGR